MDRCGFTSKLSGVFVTNHRSADLKCIISSPRLEVSLRIFHPNPFRSFYMQQMAQYDPPEIEQEPGCWSSGRVDRVAQCRPYSL